MADLGQYTSAGFFVDSDATEVIDYAALHGGTGGSDIERAVRLYYAVRDGFRYNPWGVGMQPEAFKASNVLARDRQLGAHCIDKAVILAAGARALGIPSRLHFANVRNHIGTEKLEQMLGTDLLVFHGYTELHLDGSWVAATPAFNKGLCERLGVAPLEFDGINDSIFQQFDVQGGKFMEYVHDYGAHAEIPYDLMVGEWKKHYRHIEALGRWPTPEDASDVA